MRTILVAGSTALILAFGAASAYANGPLFSPYEVLVPQPAQQQTAPPEGRASYVGDDRGQTFYAPQQDNSYMNNYGLRAGSHGR